MRRGFCKQWYKIVIKPPRSYLPADQHWCCCVRRHGEYHRRFVWGWGQRKWDTLAKLTRKWARFEMPNVPERLWNPRRETRAWQNFCFGKTSVLPAFAGPVSQHCRWCRHESPAASVTRLGSWYWTIHSKADTGQHSVSGWQHYSHEWKAILKNKDNYLSGFSSFSKKTFHQKLRLINPLHRFKCTLK